jgi:uncharacterized protein YjiS (DUF1127 family)
MSFPRIANPLRSTGRPAGRVIAAPLPRLWAWVAEVLERRRALRQLATMDERMLRDIGLHRGNAEEVIRQGRADRPRALPWWTT